MLDLRKTKPRPRCQLQEIFPDAGPNVWKVILRTILLGLTTNTVQEYCAKYNIIKPLHCNLNKLGSDTYVILLHTIISRDVLRPN